MRAIPGGFIPPSDVVGRAALINQLWRALQRQSLVLTAERRLGKTTIIRTMASERSQDRVPIYRDLEKIHSPLEFVETVFEDVEQHLSMLQRTAVKARQLLAQLQGSEVKGLLKFPAVVAPHWKALLVSMVDDLMSHHKEPPLFFWDELPYMLYNIKRGDGGERAATELLDTLRALRQMHPALRMVYTGSIGLHNVLGSLKRSGYANAPTNDMHTVDVPPLAPADAHDLARRLLEGEGLRPADPAAVAQAIAAQVDCIPYFIHHIVNELALGTEPPDVAAVGRIVHARLTDDQDLWNLHYYRERIDVYYDADERRLALAILDDLAVADDPLPFVKLFDLLKARIATEDRERAHSVLNLLRRDHYVLQEESGPFRFRFPLIQRFWRLYRGL